MAPRVRGAGLVFDEDGFEAFGEERAVALVGLVEPDGEALLEQLHEGGDVAHECELPLAPRLALGSAGGELALDHLEPFGLILGRLRVKEAVAAQQLGVGRDGLLRHAHEHMEVVAQDGVREDFDAAELGGEPELFSQDLLCRVVDHPLPVHRAGHAVVHRRRLLRRDLDARRPHRRAQTLPTSGVTSSVATVF